jgi:hypothetical protein
MCNHSESASTGHDRREFLAASITLPAVALPTAALIDMGTEAVPQKLFGKTTEKVSALGLGGHTLGLAPTLKEATRIVHEAIDAGVTFMDNAWEYHGPQRRMDGRGAEGQARQGVFDDQGLHAWPR